MNTAYHKKFGTVEVLETSVNLTRIESEGKSFWVKKETLTDKAPLTASERRAIREREIEENSLRCAHVQDAFTSFLVQNQHSVEIYFTYDIHTLARVESVLQDLGIAGVDHQPRATGARGGQTILRGLDFRLQFPWPESEDILPRDPCLKSKHIGKRGYIHNLYYALELAKLYGFRLTNSKKILVTKPNVHTVEEVRA